MKQKSLKLIWTTRDGEQISLKHMTPTHLANCINHLYRRIKNIKERNKLLMQYGIEVPQADKTRRPDLSWIHYMRKELKARGTT